MGASNSKVSPSKEQTPGNFHKRKNISLKNENAKELHKTISGTIYATLTGQSQNSWESQFTVPENCDKNMFLTANLVEAYNTLVLVIEEASPYCTCDKFKIAPSQSIEHNDLKCMQQIEHYCDLIEKILDAEIVKDDEEEVKVDKKLIEKHIHKITSMILKIYAHFDYVHREKFKEDGLEPYFNNSFKSFLLFVLMHGLIEVHELDILESTVCKLLKKSSYNPFKNN